MELREYALILRKHWVLVVVSAFVGLAAGAGISLLVTPEYQSRTQLYVSVRSEGGETGELVQGANYSRQIVNSYVAVIQMGVVLDPVVEELQLDMTGAELSDYVSASSPPDSALIEITTTSPSPEQAAQIANSVRESFQNVVQTQLEPETEDGESPVSLTTTQAALVPSSPVSPNVLLNLLLGLLMGLASGYGIAVLRSMMDNRIHSVSDIQAITDAPLLGGVIDDPRAEQNLLVVSSQPQSPRAESFRALRTNLQFLQTGSKGRVFVITSSVPGEGKSTTALNLGLALAQAGSRVAVVEADLRLSKFSEYLGIEGSAGLTDILIGRADMDDVLQRWGQDQFYVLPTGQIPPNPSELLGSTEMEGVVADLREQFDYVIIDAPPAGAVTDAVVLGGMAAGFLVVVATGSTTKEELEGTMRVLNAAGANVLGLVAMRVPASAPSNYGYGTYGYGYGDATSVQKTVGPSTTDTGLQSREPHAE